MHQKYLKILEASKKRSQKLQPQGRGSIANVSDTLLQVHRLLALETVLVPLHLAAILIRRLRLVVKLAALAAPQHHRVREQAAAAGAAT